MRLAVDLKNFMFVIDSDFERAFGFSGLKEINLILHDGKASPEHYTALDTKFNPVDAHYAALDTQYELVDAPAGSGQIPP